MALPLTYNARHLLARRLSSGLTFLIVAVVVFVLALLLSFVAGIRAALGATGSPRNIIVLKPGATAESTSLIPLDDLGPLIQTPGLAAAEPVTGTSAWTANAMSSTPRIATLAGAPPARRGSIV